MKAWSSTFYRRRSASVTSDIVAPIIPYWGQTYRPDWRTNSDAATVESYITTDSNFTFWSDSVTSAHGKITWLATDLADGNGNATSTSDVYNNNDRYIIRMSDVDTGGNPHTLVNPAPGNFSGIVLQEYNNVNQPTGRSVNFQAITPYTIYTDGFGYTSWVFQAIQQTTSTIGFGATTPTTAYNSANYYVSPQTGFVNIFQPPTNGYWKITQYII